MEATHEVWSDIGEIGFVDLQSGGLSRPLVNSMSDKVVSLFNVSINRMGYPIPTLLSHDQDFWLTKHSDLTDNWIGVRKSTLNRVKVLIG